MKIIKSLIIASALAFATLPAAFASETKGFMEDNDMWISVDQKSDNGMTEEIFNAVIDKVENVYAPIVDKAGGRLNIQRKWADGTVNAYASRRGRTYNVAMFGGLARHPVVTADAFALVVCHELGHHLGGIPKMPGFFARCATNEGQSDYYASLKCMRKVFMGDDNAAIMANVNVPAKVVRLCSESFSDSNEQFLCQRNAMAGYSLARLLQTLREETRDPSFTERDSNVVTRTQHQHPATQCRLDTYVAGAICTVSDTQDVSYRDEAQGVCYRANGDKEGARPLCWFKPKRN